MNLFTTSQTFPFGVSFALIVLVAMLEGLGMLVSLSPSNLIDHALPELHSDSSLDHTLGWLHIGKVPALVLLMLFLAGYTVFGYAMQMVMHGVFGFYLPAWAAGVIAVAPGLATVRGLGALIAHIIPRDESSVVSELALIGRAGVISSGAARLGGAGARARQLRENALPDGRAGCRRRSLRRRRAGIDRSEGRGVLSLHRQSAPESALRTAGSGRAFPTIETEERQATWTTCSRWPSSLASR